MNTLELRRARDLLLSPLAMVCANAVLLSLGCYVALASPRPRFRAQDERCLNMELSMISPVFGTVALFGF